MKILLVEDNFKMRSLIKKMLQSHIDQLDEIYECDDGDRAVELFQKLNPDWTLMDIKLKGVDGLIATEKIIESDPAARIIIITQYDEPAYREAAHSAGAYDYVLKDNILDIPKIINKTLLIKNL